MPCFLSLFAVIIQGISTFYLFLLRPLPRISNRQGKSMRQLVKLTGIALNTVRDYLRRINSCNIPLQQLLALEDQPLLALVYREATDVTHHDKRSRDLRERVPHFAEHLRQGGVTRWLLWSEYFEAHPQDNLYSQFCEHLWRYLRKNEIEV